MAWIYNDLLFTTVNFFILLWFMLNKSLCFPAILLEDSLNKVILTKIAKMLNASEGNISLMYSLGIMNYKKTIKDNKQQCALHMYTSVSVKSIQRNGQDNPVIIMKIHCPCSHSVFSPEDVTIQVPVALYAPKQFSSNKKFKVQYPSVIRNNK